VLKNGESYLGRYKADQLDGLVQETISLCDRYCTVLIIDEFTFFIFFNVPIFCK
jgi:hypothetical protein